MEIFKISELLEQERKADFIPTGSIELDTILGGGLRCGKITEIHGDIGSGKTRFCLELFVNAVANNDDYHAYYLSTRPLFMEPLFKRVNYMVGEMKKHSNRIRSAEEILSRMHYLHVDSLIDQWDAIRDVRAESRKNDRVRLLIIDNFADNLPKKKFAAERVHLIYTIISDLIMCKNVAILLTVNTVERKIRMQDKKTFKTVVCNALGETFRDRVNQSFFIENHNNKLQLFVNKSVSATLGCVRFHIDEERGLIDEKCLDDEKINNKD